MREGFELMGRTIISAKNVEVYYSEKQALKQVNLDIYEQQVTSLIGPSGCGKSTFLRCINRMNDLIKSCKFKGELTIGGQNIYDPKVNVVSLRTQVGMVFQKPNPFPKSIRDNVAYGLKIHGLAGSKSELNDRIEWSLKSAGLWSEVESRLGEPALGLSGGQQQRLCIARAIAVKPKIILMDEPCSALDPIATAVIEDLINEISEKFTIVIVTHSMAQAARVSKRTAYFHLGALIEVGNTKSIFTNPLDERTQNYITGRIG